MDKQQAIRYRGHTALCEIDLPGQQAISSGRVLIVGAGGLGSPVALYLAAAGVGHITIMDADTVSLSNLQRQIIHTTPDVGRLKVESAREKMTAINPHIEVETIAEFLTPENARDIIGRHDLVVDCCDNLTSRLLVNDTCMALEKPYVYGAVQRFSGHVYTYTPGAASYRDYFDTSAAVDEPPCALNGILNTVVGVIGSLQATEAVKILARTGDLLTNRLLIFDAITMTFTVFPIGR
ncbi:MAG: HesA/MoeB/ThiF family protein [Bacteroidales bacterium]|nr:HesA/MoeB/ThiF family protein [Bacteroidales bacterium]